MFLFLCVFYFRASTSPIAQALTTQTKDVQDLRTKIGTKSTLSYLSYLLYLLLFIPQDFNKTSLPEKTYFSKDIPNLLFSFKNTHLLVSCMGIIFNLPNFNLSNETSFSCYVKILPT